MKTCYYQLLEVESNVNSEDLKKAYRKKALEWHPDKNFERVDLATQQFSLIQQAYEVLSDPNERSWYDGHRDAILREEDDEDKSEQLPKASYGGSAVAGTTTNDIMNYFSSGCFTGYEDGTKGYYSVYRNLFQKLAEEEEQAFNYDRSEDAIEFIPMPSFGNSSTPINDDIYENMIKLFYNVWSNFSTRKTFKWLDKYRLSEAPDRRTRKLMEKENQKTRETGRRDYNEAVRELVKFVQKRDPRWKVYLETLSLKNEARAAQAKALAARDRAQHIAELSNYKEPEWAKVEIDQKQVDNDENEEDEDEENDGDETEEFFCVACNKNFKHDKQWKNHEKSKKHLRNVHILKKEMLYENDDISSRSEINSPQETLTLLDNKDGSDKFKIDQYSTVSSPQIDPISIKIDQEEAEDINYIYSNLSSIKGTKKQKKKQRKPNWGYDDNISENRAVQELDSDSSISNDVKLDTNENDLPDLFNNQAQISNCGETSKRLPDDVQGKEKGHILKNRKFEDDSDDENIHDAKSIKKTSQIDHKKGKKNEKKKATPTDNSNQVQCNLSTVDCSIAVMKKTAKISGSNDGFKSVLPKKKRRGSVLEDGFGGKSIDSKVQNSRSWSLETGDTTESNSINIEKECLVEKTSFDFGEGSAIAEEDPNQTLTGSKVKTKKALSKPLGKINFSSNGIDDNVLLDTPLELPLPLKNLVNISVHKSFALDIGLDKMVGKSSQEKLQVVRRALFTSELSLTQASKKAKDTKILVNTDLKKFSGCSDRAVVVKEIPVKTSAEAVHTMLSEFEIIKLIKMQLVNYADLVTAKWSILIGKDAVCVARSDIDKKTWDRRDIYRAFLYTLLIETNAHDIWDYVNSVSEKTCAIDHHSITYVWAKYAIVCFESAEFLDAVMNTIPVLKDVNLHWS
ncbi:hypothetical protein G9A89_010370 [Geosiphon pyriformis]|nr:hypothetical protein G9A89_010370 [Geosiphon pyriformis]